MQEARSPAETVLVVVGALQKRPSSCRRVLPHLPNPGTPRHRSPDQSLAAFRAATLNYPHPQNGGRRTRIVGSAGKKPEDTKLLPEGISNEQFAALRRLQTMTPFQRVLIISQWEDLPRLRGALTEMLHLIEQAAAHEQDGE